MKLEIKNYPLKITHHTKFHFDTMNCNSLPSDVRSTSEGPPVWLIGSASEDYLWRALQIHSSSLKSSFIRSFIHDVGGLGNTSFATVRFLSLSFLFFFGLFVTRTPRWNDFDDLYVIWRLSVQECAFWRSCWYCSPVRRLNLIPQKGALIGTVSPS